MKTWLELYDQNAPKGFYILNKVYFNLIDVNKHEQFYCSRCKKFKYKTLQRFQGQQPGEKLISTQVNTIGKPNKFIV